MAKKKLSYLEGIAMLEEQRKQAINSQNPRLYFQSCNELGIEPEDKPLYERGFLEFQKSLLESQRIAKNDERLSVLNNYHIKKSYKDAIIIFNYVKQGKINIESPKPEDITKMRRGLINIIGYTKLKGNGKEKVLTIDAKPERIIAMYQDYMAKARKMMDIQKNYSLLN